MTGRRTTAPRGQHVGRCLHDGCGWHPQLDSDQWASPAAHVELTGHLVITQQVGR